MATIKVFSAIGVKELSCFDTLSDLPYLEEEVDAAPEDFEAAEENSP